MNMFKATKATTADEYIDGLEEPRKSQIKTLHQLIVKTVPKLKPFIISGMIGYGSYKYKSKSGREGEWCVLALASQKNYISLYVCAMDGERYLTEEYKPKLPKTSIGKSCIRFKKIEDIDLEVIKDMLKKAGNLPALGQA